MSETAQRSFGSYQIISEIGRGGMAVVYKALQPSLNRYVALKVLPSNLSHDQTFITRFLQEARIAASLRHPNIIDIYEVSTTEPFFIAMQLIDGESVAGRIRGQGALALSQSISIVRQIASALDFAHARGVVHRDVKPSNIILDSNNNAILSDFGIAKAGDSTRLTMTGGFVGTPEYVSPEQIMGSAVDSRTDIYSLGIVCYEMLTGRPPFHGDTVRILYAQVHEPPPSPRSLNKYFPATIERALAKALAKEPAKRYASAGEFAAALDSALPTVQPLLTEPATRVIVPTSLAPRKEPRSFRLAGVAVALAITLFAVVLILADFNARRLSTLVASSQTPTTTSLSSMVTVPVVVGQTSAQAISLIQRAGLKVERVTQPLPVCTGDDWVLRQEPAMGRSVAAGTLVQIFVCSGPTVTPSRPPTPMPTSALVPGANVTFAESFSNTSLPGWSKGPTSSVENGVLRIQGNPDWNGMFRSARLIENGGVLVQFRFTPRARFEMHVDSGAWRAANYRRWGININSDYTFGADNIYFGAVNTGGSWQTVNLSALANHWFYLLFRIGGKKEFIMRIWDTEDPKRFLETRRAMGPDWAGLTWNVGMGGNAGTLEVSTYQELAFPAEP